MSSPSSSSSAHGTLAVAQSIQRTMDMMDMECLRALASVDYASSYESIPPAVSGTCLWFLSHPKYIAWKNEQGPSLLCVSGRVACGKSVLAKFLIEDLRNSGGVQASTVCYFFFSIHDMRRSKVASALCAILHQLLVAKPFLIRYLRQAFEFRGQRVAESTHELWKILVAATRDPECGSVVCILDGIDECEEPDNMLQEIAAGSSWDGSNPKFLLTSRPVRSTLRRVPEENIISLESSNELDAIRNDIIKVVKDKVQKLGSSRGLKESTTLQLEETMVSNAGDIYLWAISVLNDLEHDIRLRARVFEEDKLLHRLPMVLEEVYESLLWERSDTKDAKDILRRVIAATRHLTVKEMAIALTIRPHDQLIEETEFSNERVGAQYLLQSGGQLITVIKSTIYLLHDSVRDFLIRDSTPGILSEPTAGRPTFKHSLTLAESNLALAKSCVSYLLIDEFETRPLTLILGDRAGEDIGSQVDAYVSKHGFLNYAAGSWPRHVREAKDVDNELWDMVNELCNVQSARFQTWFQVYWNTIHYSARFPQGFTNLMVLSYFGLDWLVEKQLARKSNLEIDASGENGWTALICAAREGHGKVVTQLLAHDADVKKKDRDGRTALHHAATHGHSDVLKVLLNNGANPVDQDVAGCSPLHYAAEGGHQAALIVLLEGGAQTEERDKSGRTALHYAAKNGEETALRLLLSRGADSEAKDNDGRTARELTEHENAETTARVLRSTELVLKDVQALQTSIKSITGLLKASELLPRLSDSPIKETDQVDGQFTTVIVDFSAGIAHHLDNAPTVNKAIGGEARVFRNSSAVEPGEFRWLHLPANNMRWIELLMLQYENVGKCPKREDVLRGELWIERLHKGSNKAAHALFMRPVCQAIDASSDSIVLMLPYIHWETEKKYLEMKDFIKDVVTKKHVEGGSTKSKNEELIRAYLNPETAGGNSLHIRRTLDQYYYHSLKDTTERDTDQVTTRLFDRKELCGDKVLMMVDQLWLWLLGGDTVITSFPERWSREEGVVRVFDRTDVLENIIGNSSSIRSPHELVELIICECLRTCLDPTKNTTETLQFLENYEISIGRVSNDETRQFNEFSKQVTKDKLDGSSREHNDSLDIKTEVDLLKEIKDIRDELHTMLMLFRDQEKVLEDLHRIAKQIQLRNPPEIEERAGNASTTRASPAGGEIQRILYEKPLFVVKRNIEDIQKMDGHARRTYEALEDLLDLKQKHANVLEARWGRDEAAATRRQAVETAKQGNTILVFTIVTIVFLPLSFIAAFFAINIVEFPKGPDGLHLDYVSKYMFSISAAIILPLLIVAFNVNEVAATFDRFGRWTSKHKLVFVSTTTPTTDATPGKDEKSRYPTLLNQTDPQPIPGKDPGIHIDNEEKKSAPDSNGADSAEILPDTAAGDRWRMFLVSLLYIFVIFPLEEIGFAFRLLKYITHPIPRPTAEQKSQETVAAATNPATKAESQSTNGQTGETADSKNGWELRGGVKQTISIAFGFVRLCFMLVWIPVLLVEWVVLMVIYGVMSIFFKDSPLQAMVKSLAGFLWSKLKPGPKGDTLAQCEEGRQKKE